MACGNSRSVMFVIFAFLSDELPILASERHVTELHRRAQLVCRFVLDCVPGGSDIPLCVYHRRHDAHSRGDLCVATDTQ